MRTHQMLEQDLVHEPIVPGLPEENYVAWYIALIGKKARQEFLKDPPDPDLEAQIARLVDIYKDAPAKAQVGRGRLTGKINSV